jgi:hypothetical protein
MTEGSSRRGTPLPKQVSVVGQLLCRFLAPASLMAVMTVNEVGANDLPRPADLLAVEVSRQQSLDPRAFDDELRAARQAQQDWASDVVQIASRFLRPEIGRTAVWTLDGAGERPGTYRVVIATDGIPDDSIRGRRYEAVITRAADGGWVVSEARVSWRCWREPDSVFDTRPCP